MHCMKFIRTINLATLLENKSHFLLGPRGTGNGFLIKQQLGEQAFLINLLGGLPFVYASSAPQEELHAYVKTYIQEERITHDVHIMPWDIFLTRLWGEAL